MVIVRICIGSSCYLKGSQDIVEMLESSLKEYGIEDEVVLSGSLCLGKCNRQGVTVEVDDEIFVGITKENYQEFFKANILKKVNGERM